MKELYLEDSYIKEFQSRVVGSNLNCMELESTAFYPGGGGQPCDTGKIFFDNKQLEVLEVFKQSGKIIHVLNSDAPQIGTVVNGLIDWEKRYKLMRMHTAMHILSAVFFKELGSLITGNQIGVEKSRIDFNLKNFDRELMKKLFEKANSIAAQGIPVQTYFIRREDALKKPEFFKLALKLPPATDMLRIVKIGDVDEQADGGTHVKNTKEIGKIELLELENRGKYNKRAYFRVLD
jgi:Ser-tRNA(Ala) deacylase AlaX